MAGASGWAWQGVVREGLVWKQDELFSYLDFGPGLWRMNRNFPERQGKEKHSRKKEQHVWRNWDIRHHGVSAFFHPSVREKQFHTGLTIFASDFKMRLHLRITQWALWKLWWSEFSGLLLTHWLVALFASLRWWEWLGSILSYFVQSDITIAPAASLGHAIQLALWQKCSRPHWAHALPPHLTHQPPVGKQMRTKHNERGRQSYIVQGPWVPRPVCLQLLDLCDLEKGFGVSEPVCSPGNKACWADLI